MNAQESQGTLGRFDIVREIGRGGVGVVYHAVHRFTRRHVALKILQRDVLAKAHEERFLAEASAGVQIGHPDIVTVLDAGRLEDGRLYLTMELLEGETVEERLERGTSAWEEIDLLRQALVPIAAAHDAGIVHRDLKPANLFIARDPGGETRVKVLDFGIACGPSTQDVSGTPEYMSPEQAYAPAQVGPATDVWAIGVALYDALTGELPFTGEDAAEILAKVKEGRYVPVGKLAPSVHPELEALVDACLAERPADRIPHARALLARLDALLHRREVRATLGRHDPEPEIAKTALPRSGPVTPSVTLPVHRPSTRRLAPVFAAGALALVAGLGGALLMAGRSHAHDLPRSAMSAASVATASPARDVAATAAQAALGDAARRSAIAEARAEPTSDDVAARIAADPELLERLVARLSRNAAPDEGQPDESTPAHRERRHERRPAGRRAQRAHAQPPTAPAQPAEAPAAASTGGAARAAGEETDVPAGYRVCPVTGRLIPVGNTARQPETAPSIATIEGAARGVAGTEE